MKYSFSYLINPDNLYSFCYENYNLIKDEKKQLLLKREKINHIKNDFNIHIYNNVKNDVEIYNNKNDYKLDKNSKKINNKNYNINSINKVPKNVINKNNEINKIYKDISKYSINKEIDKTLKDNKIIQINNIDNKSLLDKNIKNINNSNNDLFHYSKENKNIKYNKKDINNIHKTAKNIKYNNNEYIKMKNEKINDIQINETMLNNTFIKKSNKNISNINNVKKDVDKNSKKINNKNYNINSINKVPKNVINKNNEINKIYKDISKYSINKEIDKNYKGNKGKKSINKENKGNDKFIKNLSYSNIYEEQQFNNFTKKTDDINNTKKYEYFQFNKNYENNFSNIEHKENNLHKHHNKKNKKFNSNIENKRYTKNNKNKNITNFDNYKSFNYKENNKNINTQKNENKLNRIGSKNIQNINKKNIVNKQFSKNDKKNIKFNNHINIDKTVKKTIQNGNQYNVKEKITRNSIKNINIKKQTMLNKQSKKDIVISKNQKNIYSQAKNIYVEDKVRLGTLYKRLWFIKGIGEIDYKILPNIDYNYPAPINIFVEQPNFEYYFEYKTFCDNYFNGEYIIELYDYDYNTISILKTNNVEEKEVANDIISLKISKEIFNDVNENEREHYKFEIKIKYPKVNYIIIRQPTNTFDNEVLYTVTEKFLGENKHPIPFGNELGLREIPIHINIMVEFINVLLLLWQQRFVAFGGQLGIQGIYGLVNLVYEWLTLETSIENNEYIEEYNRCFRWLRWEAEKTYNLAKADTKLNANNWINFMINEMINYIEMHHIDVIPILENIINTDDWRNQFNEPTLDIKIVLDKMKGKRKRLIANNKMQLTNKPIDKI